MKSKIILSALFLIVIVALSQARVYTGLNYGIAGDRGGIELYPDTGVFLCSADYNPATQETHNYNVPEILQFLISDC